MIKVIDSARNEHQVEGRLEKIIMLLIGNAGEIVKSTNAQITFDCSGYTVSASLKRILDTPSRPEP